MSRIRPPLTTSMTGPVTTPSSSLICSMSPQARSYWARFLDRTSRPSLSSFGEDEGLDLVAQRHDLVRVDVVADRQLPAGDHALGLVADVEQDLVPVDLDHGALDELAVLDRHHGAVDGVVEAAAEVVLGDLRGGCRCRPRRRCRTRWGRRWLRGRARRSGCRRTRERAFRESGTVDARRAGATNARRAAYTGASCPGHGRRATSRSSGVSVVGGAAGVGARGDRPDVLDRRARPRAASRRSSRGVKQVVHRSPRPPRRPRRAPRCARG